MAATDSTTIRTSTRTRERLRAIAEERGLALTEALDLVVETFDEGRFWDRVNDEFSALRADVPAAAEYDRERIEWDAVLGDGLPRR
jgi:hypothetical protein